ncbi:hypothetical protein G7Y79_00036g071880 [Physcia stellaris]|nr:hypothetical protein G7Y79_00036g071880 [Physcia stellaris]
MPPILPSNPDIYLHNGESVYTSLGEKFDIPPETLGSLGEQAIKAKDLAYCPYSSFRVGCAVLSAEDGVIVTGANVENASYPVGACAETTTVGKAVTEGHKRIKGVAVATDISPPRRSIREFAAPTIPILMYDSQGSFIVKTLEEFSIFAFCMALALLTAPTYLSGDQDRGYTI